MRPRLDAAPAPFGISPETRISAIKQLLVCGRITRDHGCEIEFLLYERGSAGAHGLRVSPLIKQVENFFGQIAGRVRRHEISVPAVTNDVGASRHSCGHDWKAGSSRFQQYPRYAFAQFSRKREHIGDAE